MAGGGRKALQYGVCSLLIGVLRNPRAPVYLQAECAVAAASNGFTFAGSVANADKPAGCHHSFITNSAGQYIWVKGAYSWNPISDTESQGNNLAAPVCAQLSPNELCVADGDFVQGALGASTCPSGTSVIDTREECAGAAKSLGLIPFGSAINGTNGGLAFETVKKPDEDYNPHPGCSYNVGVAAANAVGGNDEIVNFNSNLSPLADLDPAATPLCRCSTPATEPRVAGAPGSLSLSPVAPGATAKKQKDMTIILVILSLVCVAGIVIGVVRYRKYKADNFGAMNVDFLML